MSRDKTQIERKSKFRLPRLETHRLKLPTLRLGLMAIISLILIASGVVPLAGAQDLLFFSRSSDIGEDRVWIVDEFSEGDFTFDLTVARWDAAKKEWTECDTDAPCNTNEGRLAWNTNVYSPVDGKIKTCWRGFPDNSAPGVKESGVGTTIFSGGNHVNIETADGNVVLLAHLKQNSIPARLCPDPRGASSSNASKPAGFDYPPPAVIPISSRPVVKRGEFIGTVGNSGNSGQPHVHINIQPKDTDTTEKSPFAMKFIQGWMQSYKKSQQAQPTWIRLNSRAVTKANGNTMFHPSPFLRRADISAGPVFDLDMVDLPFLRHVVTAVSDEQRNLKLISWFTDGTSIVRKADISAGRISEVKMVRESNNNVVVGVRDEKGDLKLILFSVGNSGQLARKADASAGPIGRLAMATTQHLKPKVVTAVRDSGGNLKIIVWDVPDNSSQIQRLSDAGAGPVADVAITRAKNFHGVITAVRQQNGNLKIIPWRISTDGRQITRGADAEAGVVGSQISITSIQQGVVVAARDSDGNLRIITWEISTNGDIVARRDTLTAGKVSEVDIDTTASSGSNVVTTVRDSGGDLRLIAWTMDPRGRNLRRSSSSTAGNISTFSAVGSGRSSGDILLTAVKDSGGKFKLILWDVNLIP